MSRYVLLAFILLFAFQPAFVQATPRNGDDVDVLLLYPDDYGTNGNLVEKTCEILGWNVTRTGVSNPIPPCPWLVDWRYNPPIVPDLMIDEIDDVTAYDAVLVMSSPHWVSRPYSSLTGNGRVLALLQQAVAAGLVVGGYCGGPRVLAAAGLLEGVTITGHAAFTADYDAAGAIYLGPNIPSVIDGQITTNTRGLYYELENTMAVATALEGLHPGSGWQSDAASSQALAPALSGLTPRWVRAIGGPAADVGHAVIAAPDGGYLVAGQTASLGAGAADIYVVNTDADGQLQWSRTYGGTGWDQATGIARCDGGHVICGWTTSRGAVAKDVLVMKIDESGDEVWSRNFGGSGVDLAWAVCEADDGDILVAGSTESSGAGEDDVFLIRLSSDGDERWARTYGGPAADVGCAVVAMPGGGCAVAGATGSFGSGNRDAYLLAVATDGTLTWQQTYGWNNAEQELVFDWARALIRTTDGGFALAGSSNFASLHNLILIRTDATGQHVWHRYYGPSTFYDHGADLAQASDGGFWLCGTTCSSEDRDSDLYLVRTDAVGRQVWDGQLGGADREYGHGLVLDEDGGVVLVGQSRSTGLGSHDVILAAIADPTLTAAPIPRAPRSDAPRLHPNHPNPFNPSTNVAFEIPRASDVRLTVLDVSGREVRTLAHRPYAAGFHSIRWDGCDTRGHAVESGVYLARLQAGGRTQSRRMTLIK